MRVRTRVVGAAAAGALVGAAVVGGAVWAGGGGPTAAASGCGGSSPELTVQGTGLSTGTPDQLTLTVDVSVIGATAQAALSEDDTQAAAVVAALTRGGVSTADVQTTGLSVQPDYTTQGGNTVLAGYAVDNSVVATIDDLGTAGSDIDSVADAAGDDVRIDSVSFSLADPRTIEDRARQDAVRQASSHAAAMAAAAGQRLARICSVTDRSSSTTSPLGNPLNQLGAASPAASVPLEAGTQQASAQVSVVYALRPAARRARR